MHPCTCKINHLATFILARAPPLYTFSAARFFCLFHTWSHNRLCLSLQVVMARKQVHSSKKHKKSASKPKRKAVPKSDSESVASEAAASPVLENPHGSDAQDAHGSDGSLSNDEQPLRSPLSQQDFHRSSEHNSPRSSPERPYRSQERTTSPHRSQERTSPVMSA